MNLSSLAVLTSRIWPILLHLLFLPREFVQSCSICCSYLENSTNLVPFAVLTGRIRPILLHFLFLPGGFDQSCSVCCSYLEDSINFAALAVLTQPRRELNIKVKKVCLVMVRSIVWWLSYHTKMDILRKNENTLTFVMSSSLICEF